MIRSVPILLMVFAAPFLAMGAFLVGAAGFQYWGYAEASRHGAEAKAQIRILKARDDLHETELSWTDQAGDRRIVQRPLSKDYVSRNRERLRVEGAVVRYLPGNSWVLPLVIGDEGLTRSIIWEMFKFGAALVLGSLAVGAAGFGLRRVAARHTNRTAAIQAASQRRVDAEAARRFVERLPFETVIVPGGDALATWERLKAEGRGYPVVLGNETEAALLFQSPPLEPAARMAAATAVFEKAQGLRHPEDLRAKSRADAVAAHEELQKLAAENPRFSVPDVVIYDAEGRGRKQRAAETRAQLLEEPEESEPPLGDWPEQVDDSARLSIVEKSVLSEPRGRFHTEIKDRVVVALLPVTHSYEVLGYLLYGGWNACPPAEYHVAALRSWSERYGAEIVGVMSDTLNLRVARKPATREEALVLAREHYLYCNDVIDQGFGTLSNLAAQVMQDDWWFFWWD